MTANRFPMVFRCEACGALLCATSMKSLSGKMRRHRIGKHATRRGRLSFKRLDEAASYDPIAEAKRLGWQPYKPNPHWWQ